MKNDQYLITDSPMRALFVFALPMIIGNFFQQTYTLVDSMVVGRYVSEDALAAIGACYAFTNVFIWVASGGGIGASVVVSRTFGARQYKTMKRAIDTALISFLAISFLLCGIGFLIGRPVMVLLRTPKEVLGPSLIYLNIYFLGLPFLFMYNVLSSMFNAIGRSRIPLYFLIFSSLLNIGLDLFMVVKLDMGIAGVAWATLIAQGLSAVLSFTVLLKMIRQYREDDEDRPDLPASGKATGIPASSRQACMQVFDWRLAREMASIALPSIIQQSTVSIGMMVVQSVVNSFGAQALAGYSAGIRIENFCCVPWGSYSAAISSFTAQNIGARKTERIRRGYAAILKMILYTSILIFVILEFFAGGMLNAFLGDNLSATALKVGTDYIRFDGIFVGLLGLKMATDGTLRGMADTRAFTIANFVNLGIRIFVSFVFAPIFGIRMVWFASPMGWTANFLISYVHLRKTKAYHR